MYRLSRCRVRFQSRYGDVINPSLSAATSQPRQSSRWMSIVPPPQKSPESKQSTSTLTANFPSATTSTENSLSVIDDKNLSLTRRFKSTTTTVASTVATTAAASTATPVVPAWMQQMDSTVPMSQSQVYRYLGLESFTDSEIHDIFDKIQNQDSTNSVAAITDADDDDHTQQRQQQQQAVLEKARLTEFLSKRIQQLESENDLENDLDDQGIDYLRQNYAQAESQRILNFFDENNTSKGKSLDKEQFTAIIKEVATSLDFKRMWPLTASMLLVGSSVGVVTPAMPFVVQDLGLTAGEYGFVVSAFALAKMSGNIPSAVLVERHGRKPYLVYSMSVIALGVGGIGLASSFEHLYVCRLLTGLGVAGLSTAATMAVTDMSTPLNRASTFAPIMSAFAAGTALGPAIGGISVDQIGIHPTFYMVGASYIGLAFINNALLDETKSKPMEFPWQIKNADAEETVTIRESFQTALGQWIPLLSETPIRNVCIMNGFYWIALAGSQMTLLPLILTDPAGLSMTATSVGQVYMGMSIVQVLGNPVLAKLVDRIGPAPGIVGGCTLISSAMAALPFCNDMYQMSGVLAVWAMGSSLLSTSPLAFISDRVDDAKRAQAIALLRTSGDVGFLVGASTMGALADWAGSLEMAMQSSSGILLTATGWFTVRQLLTSRIDKKEESS